MKKNIIKASLVKVFILSAILYVSVLSAATDEFVAHIVDLKIKSSEVTLLSKHIRNIDYRLAYDVRIRLANGEKGAVANLRKGNQITAVGDFDKKVIYDIKVLN